MWLKKAVCCCVVIFLSIQKSNLFSIRHELRVKGGCTVFPSTPRVLHVLPVCLLHPIGPFVWYVGVLTESVMVVLLCWCRAAGQWMLVGALPPVLYPRVIDACPHFHLSLDALVVSTPSERKRSERKLNNLPFI